MNSDEPLDKFTKIFFGFLALIALVVLLAIWHRLEDQAALNGNSVDLVTLQETREVVPTLENKKRELLAAEITSRESAGDPKICNLEYGCRAGMGLMGIISGTWNSTLKRMSHAGDYKSMPQYCWQFVYLPVSRFRTEPIFDPECNLAVGTWLLKTDGMKHWEPYSGPYTTE